MVDVTIVHKVQEVSINSIYKRQEVPVNLETGKRKVDKFVLDREKVKNV